MGPEPDCLGDRCAALSVTHVLNTQVSFTKRYLRVKSMCRVLGGVTSKGGYADSVFTMNALNGHERKPDRAKIDQNDVLR